MDRKNEKGRVVFPECVLPEAKKVEFANSVDFDEESHDEPPHLDLHCLSSIFDIALT